MTSTGSDQRAYQMTMSQGDSCYEIIPRRLLFAEKDTALKISPLLEGIRSLSGEKIQGYLASELHARIRDSKVRVTVIDKLAHKQYEMEPRQFEGRLPHLLASCAPQRARVSPDQGGWSNQHPPTVSKSTGSST